MRLGELAERLGGRQLEGDPDHEVHGVAALGEGGAHDLGFVRSEQFALQLGDVGAVIAPPDVAVGDRPVIRSGAPNLDFARAAGWLHPEPVPAPGVHASAFVDASAVVDPEASIGPRCTVGARSVVAAGTVLHANVTVYRDVEIGRDTQVHGGVVIREGTRIGDRVVIQPGAILGGDGFGFEFDERGGLEKVPQIGIVVIEDDVEIGANTTIDRARLGETRIAQGVKVDNLVMIAHNVEVGAGSAIVAQTGIAGSTTIGKRVFFMSQSGAANRVTIGDGSFVGARGGVVQDMAPGDRVWGFPGMPESTWYRAMMGLRKLPELLRRVRALEKRAAGEKK